MDRSFLATVAAAAVLLVAGLGAGVYLSGVVSFGEGGVDPGVSSFEAGGATCAAAPGGNVTVSVTTQDENSSATLRGNVTVPDRSYAVRHAFRTEGSANYTLAVEPVATAKPARACPTGRTALVRYVATVQVPHAGHEPYRIAVRHGNRTVRVVRASGGGGRPAARGWPRPGHRSRSVPPPSPSHATR